MTIPYATENENHKTVVKHLIHENVLPCDLLL